MKTHLNARRFQHLTLLPKNMRNVLDLNQLDHSSIMDSMDSMKEDPKFIAYLVVAINGSMLKLGAPIKRNSKHILATHYINGSTVEGNVFHFSPQLLLQIFQI